MNRRTCYECNDKKPYMGLSKNERDLSRIVALASGLGLGGVLALSQALSTKGATFSLQFSVKTAIAFVLGFVVAFSYLYRILAYRERTSRLFVASGLIVISFEGLIACIYPLRFGVDELAKRFAGVAAALCFTAGGLTLIRLVVRAAERQEEEQESKERTASNDASPRA